MPTYVGMPVIMGRKTKAIEELSGNAIDTLKRLGDSISVAIESRESKSSFAERIDLSRDTLRKLMTGDPSIQIGMLVAHWMAGLLDHLDAVAEPANDKLGQFICIGRISSGKPTLDNDFLR